MELSVTHQVFVFMCMILCGIATGLIFDLFRALRRCVKSGSGVIAAQDLALWFTELCIVYMTAFKVNNAQIRGYEAIALVIGSVLYFITVSGYVMKFFCKTFNLLKKLLKAISTPFKKTAEFIFAPLKKLKSVLKRVLAASKYSVFSALSSFMLRLRMLFTGKKKKIQ